MDSENTKAMISLPQAGAALGMTWGQTYNVLLRGVLEGEQRGNRWFVTKESVSRLANQKQNQRVAVA